MSAESKMTKEVLINMKFRAHSSEIHGIVEIVLQNISVFYHVSAPGSAENVHCSAQSLL